MVTEKIVNAFSLLTGAKPDSRKKKVRPARTVQSQTIEHPDLGKIKIAVSRRARRITLTVKPDCTVRLSIPYGTPVENGLNFLELKKDWAVNALAKYRSRNEIIVPPFRTRSHELVTEASDKINCCCARISQGKITVRHPSSLGPVDEPVQTAIKKGICEAMRLEAKNYLPQRLEYICAQTGLKYGKVAIRNTVSKWGSCSPRNDISLSLHLMRLPDHLIDYILLHELCHTVHKNHGPKFHEMLDELTDGRHLILRRELKSYHTRW